MPYLRVKNELPLIPGYSEGAIAYAPDAAAAPLNECICYINPVQSGSGEPSPSNVRPITGHTELNLVHTGKNFIDLSLANLENGSINGNTGALESGTNRVRNKDYYVFPFDKIYNSSYIITIPSGYSLAMRFYDSTGTYIAMTGESTGWITALPSLVYGKDASYVKFVFRKSDNTDITPSTISSLQYQLELGSTATAYEPYTGSTTTTDLGTTVYGGTLDVVSGVLTVTKGYADMGSLTWSKDTTTVSGKTIFKSSLSAKSQFNAICSNYNFVGAYTNLTDKTCCYIYNTWIGIEDSTYNESTLEQFKTAMSGVQLVYELATPTTIQLTPQEVKSLLGGNNFYHDCNGDTKITYIRRLDS